MSNVTIRSFTGGELAPSLYARVDLQKYQQGLRTCKNFFIQRHGGAANRSGTKFIGETSIANKEVRLIPFIFNADQTYVLEFGHQYMRVIHNGAYVVAAAKTITGITQANPGVITSNAHGYSNGDEIAISGILGMTQLNNRNFKVAGATANTYTLTTLTGVAVNTTSYTTYISGGSTYKVYQISTSYVEADLMDIQYVQSADVITLVHPTYPPADLSRSSHSSWTLSNITFAPTIAAPGGVTNSGAAGATSSWVVTTIESESYQESLASTATTSSAVPSSGAPITISWSAVTGALEYNIYRYKNGVHGFIGIASGTSFVDDGITPDTASTPPISRNPFGSSGNYPSVVTYFQQRRFFANTTNDTEKVWGSRTGAFTNFTISSPLQDDDAVTFNMAGRQVNEVRHLLDIGKFIVMTSGAEWSVQGGTNGVVTPNDINPQQHSYAGSNTLPPIIISGNALYVQARGNIVRDLGFDADVEGYRGNDLTIFSTHLFSGYTISDWCYQQVPNSIIWAVRNDGVLLGLTYVREHQVLAWHKHEFENGIVENVCSIPEGDEDYLYLVIKRVINGETRRFVERLSSRFISATTIEEATYLDSYLTYDGRNTGSTTMTLSGGTDWVYTETLTLTASAAFFSSSDIGNQIFLYDADEDIIRFSITGYTSTTVVTGTPHKTVPVSLRSTARTTWSRAVDMVSGIWHLEGQDVSVFADGFVVANPNNDSYTSQTVTNGAITLDKPYAVIHVGLPITSDLETLDIDAIEGESLSDKKKRVNRITLFLESSRGVFAGNSAPTGTDILEGLEELKIRNEEGYDDPVSLKTGVVDINIRPEWNSNGRVFIRQTDPLPVSVLAIVPSGLFPFNK